MKAVSARRDALAVCVLCIARTRMKISSTGRISDQILVTGEREFYGQRGIFKMVEWKRDFILI